MLYPMNLLEWNLVTCESKRWSGWGLTWLSTPQKIDTEKIDETHTYSVSIFWATALISLYSAKPSLNCTLHIWVLPHCDSTSFWLLFSSILGFFSHSNQYMQQFLSPFCETNLCHPFIFPVPHCQRFMVPQHRHFPYLDLFVSRHVVGPHPCLRHVTEFVPLHDIPYILLSPDGGPYFSIDEFLASPDQYPNSSTFVPDASHL